MKIFFQIIFLVLILLSLYFSLSSSGQSVPVAWNDKAIHCFSYFLLMMVTDFSFKPSKHLLVKAVLILMYSALIEYAQGFIPGRDTSVGDILANASGVFIFLVCVPVLVRAKVYPRLKLV